jgi:hypothetical protein
MLTVDQLTHFFVLGQYLFSFIILVVFVESLVENLELT